MSLHTDRDMERVYRLVPTLGHKRAITEVAGTRPDETTGAFVPFSELIAELSERYSREMAEFTEAGGY